MARSRQLLPAVRQHRATLALGAGLFAFFLLKLCSLNFVSGDEHMYFTMSLLVARGEWPYRDFFFSHPPLQLYLVAPLYLLFGHSLGLSKLVPSLAGVLSGVHVYLIGKRLAGRLEGVLGALLFLFTYDVLRGSSHFTGANCALALGMVATYQAIAGRQVVAGILFALGTFTGVYIAPLALMLVVLLALRSWREALRLVLTFAIACLAIAGQQSAATRHVHPAGGSSPLRARRTRRDRGTSVAGYAEPGLPGAGPVERKGWFRILARSLSFSSGLCVLSASVVKTWISAQADSAAYAET